MSERRVEPGPGTEYDARRAEGDRVDGEDASGRGGGDAVGWDSTVEADGDGASWPL